MFQFLLPNRTNGFNLANAACLCFRLIGSGSTVDKAAGAAKGSHGLFRVTAQADF
jgi:hypothetical protein